MLQFFLGNGAQSLTPDVISVGVTVVAPTLTLGAVTLSVPVITVSTTTVAPTITLGSVTLTVPVSTVSTTTVAPALTLGAVTLTVPTITVNTTVVAPSLTLGAVTLTVPVITVTTAVVAPSLTQVLTITAPTISVSTTVVAPSVTLGPLSLTVPAITVTVTVVPPVVGAPIPPLTVPTIGPTTTVVAPSVTLGPLSLTVPAITVTTTLVAPTVRGTNLLHPLGRQGIGVVQPQSGLDYPFVAPSEDVRYLLADAYLEFEDPSTYASAATAYALPFSVAWLYGLGTNPVAAPGWAPTPTHGADVVIKDANGVVVFDSTEADYYESVDWDPIYRIFEWRTDEAICRLVVHNGWSPDNTPPRHAFDDNIAPTNGVLDSRVTFRMPRRVKSFLAVLDEITKVQVVELVAGFNIELTDAGQTANPGGRLVQRIQMAAAPGGGDGLFPGCEESELVIRAINSVTPTTPGDFLLGAQDCYSFRQPTTIVSADPRLTTPTIEINGGAAHLQLSNDCGPCCTCDMYEDTVRYLNRLRDDFVALGEEAEEGRDRYHANLERWEANKACRETRAIRAAIRAQECPYFDVAAQFCNQTDECRKDITLIMRMQCMPTTDGRCECTSLDGTVPVHALPVQTGTKTIEVVEGYTIITNSVPRGQARYQLQGEWCEYRAHWDSVNPHESVSIRFRLQMPEPATPYVLIMCVHGSEEGEWICEPDGITRANDYVYDTLSCE